MTTTLPKRYRVPEAARELGVSTATVQREIALRQPRLLPAGAEAAR